MATFLASRLLPLQLLGERASATEHKVYRLNLALTAETGDAATAFLRTYSLAFDMGVESRMFCAPSTAAASTELRKQLVDQEESHRKLDLVCLPPPADDALLMNQVDRMCPRALALADCDHAACPGIWGYMGSNGFLVYTCAPAS